MTVTVSRYFAYLKRNIDGRCRPRLDGRGPFHAFESGDLYRYGVHAGQKCWRGVTTGRRRRDGSHMAGVAMRNPDLHPCHRRAGRIRYDAADGPGWRLRAGEIERAQ